MPRSYHSRAAWVRAPGLERAGEALQRAQQLVAHAQPGAQRERRVLAGEKLAAMQVHRFAHRRFALGHHGLGCGVENPVEQDLQVPHVDADFARIEADESGVQLKGLVPGQFARPVQGGLEALPRQVGIRIRPQRVAQRGLRHVAPAQGHQRLEQVDRSFGRLGGKAQWSAVAQQAEPPQ
jgi:hypothetical protein